MRVSRRTGHSAPGSGTIGGHTCSGERKADCRECGHVRCLCSCRNASPDVLGRDLVDSPGRRRDQHAFCRVRTAEPAAEHGRRIFILFERPYNVGDKITYSGEDVEGTVEEIALRTTVIRADDGTRVVAPNSFVLTKAIANHSPDRAVITIVTVHGAGSPGRTPDETRALAESTLSTVDGLSACPEITVRSRLANRHIPRLMARVPRLGAWMERVLENAKDQGTQVRISWNGFNDPVVLDDVLRKLGEAFPDSRIGTRRW